MAHRLNTNKQFMIGNGLLAFAVLIVIAIFVYISMKAQRDKDGTNRYYTEVYTISLTKGFLNKSYSIYINDSLLVNQPIEEEPFMVEVKRFADQNALMIVDNETDALSTFNLSERGGKFSFIKDEDGIKQLAN
ncbi:hypothetical protein [Bacteroides sp. 519]|uniref:hypothetical protein n=1 Tax=Bacteroides sp. 519 TaxID=2302937 RepID=UPI0013D24B43|nr:hypothetical protein [Bacteroides sp. 519]NDV58047.1 hypothetical protein [Bacteroides sp. 519]